MHILVIGGAGYIGSHVVKALLDKGMRVTVFDNLSTGLKINFFEKAEYVVGDILNYDEIASAMQKNVDGVVLLAAKKAVGESMSFPEKYALNNISGTINVLNAMSAHNVKNLVFSSSAAVYGMPEYLPIDEQHPLNPINFYGFTKYDIEKYFEWYDRLKGIKYVSLRYFNAVGYDETGDVRGLEKNPQNLLPIVMETAVGIREKMQIFGNDYDTRDGTCIRDYIHVTDLAAAHIAALDFLSRKQQSEIFNLGTETGISVLEMVNKTEELLGLKINYEFAPRRPGDPAVLTASVGKARKVLGWTATHSSLENIILSTWQAYKH